jgi:tetratricopeptide (TPR) repeat protein
MKRRAEAYNQAKQPKKAILMYNRILRIAPDISVIKECARLYCLNLQYDKAREVLRKAPTPNIIITFMICEIYLKEHNYK